jgi:hypothetical protein
MENKLQHKERSTGLIAILTDSDSARAYERSLTIKKIVKEAIPITELKKHVEPREIAIALDIQLTRLVANLNLKWTVNDSQVKTIVEDLLEKYPNETLEDFILCFKKARQGEYGELIRLDSAIIFTWMTIYLEEKYEALEDELQKEKDRPYELPDKAEGPGYRAFKEWSKKLTEQSRTPGLTRDDVLKYGQSEPKRRVATGGWKYYKVWIEQAQGYVEVQAIDEDSAKRIVSKMLADGILIIDKD